MLRKGVGLCHGISGNAWALLMLHQWTGDALWLRRAYAFAHFAVSQCESRDSPLVTTPDDPFGLVNGIGGLVVLLAALRYVMGGGKATVRMPIC